MATPLELSGEIDLSRLVAFRANIFNVALLQTKTYIFVDLESILKRTCFVYAQNGAFME